MSLVFRQIIRMPRRGMRKFIFLIPLIFLGCVRQVIEPVEPDLLIGPVVICDSLHWSTLVRPELKPLSQTEIDSLEVLRLEKFAYHSPDKWWPRDRWEYMRSWLNDTEYKLKYQGKDISNYHKYLINLFAEINQTAVQDSLMRDSLTNFLTSIGVAPD